MAGASGKHGRDQALDFQGFLNHLQDWEMSFGDKEKKMKSQGLGKEKLVSSSHKAKVVANDRRQKSNETLSRNLGAARQYDNSGNYDSIRHMSSGFMMEESPPDAVSEKELGNEFFKQKKFNEAIVCYSRSIALSPTAVAYANRAMSYLKLKRYQEAEDDCTEALNLDDRYIKAYSRRSTARKALGKLKESYEDAEFALRLEPQNQEIKKQYAEAKSLYDKEMLKKLSGASGSSAQGMQKAEKPKVSVNEHFRGSQSASSSSQKMEVGSVQENHIKDNDGQAPTKRPTAAVMEIQSRSTSKGEEANASHEDAGQSSSLESSKRNHRMQELKGSVQELAARAASLAKLEAERNIKPPNSAYQFEASWRGLSGDRTLQARLLKVTPPVALPQILKMPCLLRC
ncbi:hypothetical protein NMG60_11020869 [Bertholletia excelsa]